MNKRNTIKQLLHRGCLLMGISAITSSAFAWDFAEHRKIGDRAMSLLPRYLVENGIFPNEAVADSALLQILNMSHMPGSNAYAMNELTQLPNIRPTVRFADWPATMWKIPCSWRQACRPISPRRTVRWLWRHKP